MTPRLYFPQSLTTGQSILLQHEWHNYLARVLRCKIGDAVNVFNGEGGVFVATVQAVEKKQVTLLIQKYHAVECESPLRITLGQALIRGEKLDWAIQKAVEIGVTEINLLTTALCQAKLPTERSEHRLHHWQRVISSACEQSGRNRVPTIISPQSLVEWCAHETAELSLVLDPGASQSLQQLTCSKPQSVRLLVGPESGLSGQEVQTAQDHGFIPIRLGPRVLRTETAALACVAVLQHLWGDY